MKRRVHSALRQRVLTVLCVFVLVHPLIVAAWGEKGHLMVNQLAIEGASADLPPFMKIAARQLTFNGYEPDRWRQETGSAMNTAQAPDHFIDSEMWGSVATIPPDRYAFTAALIEKKIDPSKIGFLPYAILENYGRLRNAFRQWRAASDDETRKFAEANAIYTAGVMGHYVADSTMPMHLSIHFNGWADGSPNPKGYTTDRTLHNRYETAYVNAAIDADRVRPLVRRPKRLPDVFAALKEHLGQTVADVETTYAMEKTGEFNPMAPRPKGTEFISQQLARATNMLEDLWYTAWMESAEAASAPRP